MKNIDSWKSSKYLINNNQLKASRNTKHVAVSSRLVADIHFFLDKLNYFELYHYDLGNIKLINKSEEVRESNERNFIIKNISIVLK